MNDSWHLLSALVHASPQVAEAAWRRWRKEVDLQEVSWRSVQLIALLDRVQWAGWTVEDPDIGLLRGIARRAWTESQLKLRVLRNCTHSLIDAGVSPVLPAGPCAVFLQNRRPDSIRPLPDVEILIPRAHLWSALRILEGQGWMVCGHKVEAKALNWVTHVTLQRGGLNLKLFWRHLSVPPWRARECEDALFAASRSQMSPEHLMLSVLGSGASSEHSLPWQADAALVGLSDAQWQQWGALAKRWAPSAFTRLSELRQLGAPAPTMSFSRWSMAKLEELVHGGLRRLLMPLRRWRKQLSSRLFSRAPTHLAS